MRDALFERLLVPRAAVDPVEQHVRHMALRRQPEVGDVDGAGDVHAALARSASSIAASAASALAPSGPPACAMSGRPPPPLPPSVAEAMRTRSTALWRGSRSAVTATTTLALPSSASATIATTPE